MPTAKKRSSRTPQKKAGLPKIVGNKPGGYTLRACVAGCDTGVEDYSLGIILREYIEQHRPDMNIQIFATDLDEDAIQRARAGLYSADISADVNPGRLKMFFKKDVNGYRVRAGLREAVIFAKQSVIKDPPCTKLDLICCRNLLIYLETELQKRLLPLLYHSMDIPTIFLDADLRVRRFSASAGKIADLLETDIGRPFNQLSSKILDVDLEQAIQKVHDTRVQFERQVKTIEGHFI